LHVELVDVACGFVRAFLTVTLAVCAFHGVSSGGSGCGLALCIRMMGSPWGPSGFGRSISYSLISFLLRLMSKSFFKRLMMSRGSLLKGMNVIETSVIQKAAPFHSASL
jgi:hypothetical protein